MEDLEPILKLSEFSLNMIPSFINSKNVSRFPLSGKCTPGQELSIQITTTSSPFRTKVSCDKDKLWSLQPDLSMIAEGPAELLITDSSFQELVRLPLTKDTIAPLAVLQTTIPSINSLTQIPLQTKVDIDLAFISYKVGPAANIQCEDSNGYSPWIKVGETPSLLDISDSILFPEANLALCLRGKDSYENEQSLASAYRATWIKNLNSATAVLSGIPASITRTPSYSITVSGSNIVSYKFKLLQNQPMSSCQNLSGYSSEISISSPVQGALSVDASMLLCVLGKKSNGVWQDISSPSMALWTFDTTAPSVSLAHIGGSAPGFFVQNILTEVRLNTVETSPITAQLEVIGTGVLLPITFPGGFTSQLYNLSVPTAVKGQSYTVKVTATDSAGNTSDPVTLTVISDQSGPTTPIWSSPTVNTPIGRSDLEIWPQTFGSIGFQWSPSTDSGSGFAHYHLCIHPSEATDCSTMDAEPSTTSIFFQPSLTTSRTEYVAEIQAVDQLNNLSSKSSTNWLAPQELWVPNLPASALAKYQHKIYLGGSFTKIGPWSGGGVQTLTNSASNLISEMKQRRISGKINVSIPDGFGGLYIGGEFNSIGGIRRKNLAHLLVDGSVDSKFIMDTDGEVMDLDLHNSTLFVGGRFSLVQGALRPMLAGISVAGTPALTSLHISSVSGTVIQQVAASKTGLIFVAGDFFDLNDTSIDNLAAIQISDSSLVPSFSPNPDNDVQALFVQGSTLYIGGSFQEIFGVSRNYGAAYNFSSKTLTNWMPESNDYIQTIDSISGSILLGGAFTKINTNIPRTGIALVDSNTGAALIGFNLSISGGYSSISTIFVDSANDWIYLAGDFNSILGASRQNLARLQLSTLNLDTWSANAEPNIWTISSFGSGNIFLGGSMHIFHNYVNRNFLAEIDMATGQPTAWNPNPNNEVTQLFVANNKLFVAGLFSSLNSTSRGHFAIFSVPDLILDSFQLSGSPTIESMDWDPLGQALYLGGSFSNLNGSSFSNIARLNMVSSISLDTSFHPSVNNSVHQIAFRSNTLFVFGSFTSPFHQMAAFNISGGVIPSFDPMGAGGFSGSLIGFTFDASDPRNAMAPIYLYGTNLNHVSCQDFCPVDPLSGSFSSSDPLINLGIKPYSATIFENKLYVSGYSSTPPSVKSTSKLLSWNRVGFAMPWTSNFSWRADLGDYMTSSFLKFFPTKGQLFVLPTVNNHSAVSSGGSTLSPLDPLSGQWLPGY